MRFSHAASRTQAIFDDEHVISYAGLAPALRLAERAGWTVWSASTWRWPPPTA
ncbi:hypothetical protein ACIBQ1_52690 [Nonomuraea sp. NPDC050153]|uniref:hypothetical protein n=1 Tax=Nonomuraea sp. NPDC050153 TaxID=3364359 RepID=UPI003792BE75